MIIPPYLRSGSKIRIVSPAGKVDEQKILAAARWLNEQGYQTILGKYVFEKHFQYAGTDSQRLHDLQEALDDPDAGAIFCSRGGYGTARIIEKADFTRFSQNPKWLVGFSDITILHICLHKLNIATIHGTMPKLFFDEDQASEENLQSLMNMLAGQKATYHIAPMELNRKGEITAPLIGGNLSIISSLMGTPYEPDTRGKILFLEDLEEYLYHTDRMVNQLKLAGKLNDLAGLVIGSFTEMKDNDTPFGRNVNEIMQEAAEEYNYPVCYNFPAGHDSRNLALMFGGNWNLKVSENKVSFNLE